MTFTVTSSRTFFFSDILVLKLSFVNNSSTCEDSLTLFTNGTASSQTFHFVFILKIIRFNNRKIISVISDIPADILKTVWGFCFM
jgi:hypothetical protein